MYDVFDYSCAHVKLVYCVTIDCLQSDLFLWRALYPKPMCTKDWWKWNLICICMYICKCWQIMLRKTSQYS